MLYVQASDATQSMSASYGSTVPSFLDIDDLTPMGLKESSDDSWSLSFGKSLMIKKSVSAIGLTRLLNKSRVQWSRDLINSKAVVNAIYSDTGGLTYAGDAKRDLTTTAGNLTQPTRNVGKGWENHTTKTGQVILFETNPCEWIIAVVHRKLEG